MFEDFTSYNILKWTHILSAFLLFGTGLGSAFYKWMADRSGNIEAQTITAKHVVLADFLFTTPSAIYQPLSGYFLLQQLGIPLSEPWVVLSFVLYMVAGLCWLPVVWLQILMRDLALEALNKGQMLSHEYNRLARIWFWLGWTAFISIILAVWLMVAKPDLTLFWS